MTLFVTPLPAKLVNDVESRDVPGYIYGAGMRCVVWQTGDPCMIELHRAAPELVGEKIFEVIDVPLHHVAILAVHQPPRPDGLGEEGERNWESWYTSLGCLRCSGPRDAQEDRLMLCPAIYMPDGTLVDLVNVSLLRCECPLPAHIELSP